MSFVAGFWRSFDWWTSAPDENAINWFGAPSDTQKPYKKTDGNNRSLVIAYIPVQLNGNVYNGTVRNLLPTSVSTSQWFNPRNGTYTIIDQGWMPTKAGLWNIPTQPTANDDWVLKIQRINGSNSLPNLAFVMNLTSSSNWYVNQSSNKVIEDDLNTNWQPSHTEVFNNSWLLVDFGVVTTFNKVTIIQNDQPTTDYRIEYLNETNWFIARIGSTIFKEGVIFPPVTGNQMRVVFTSGIGYSSTINELEVYYLTLIDI
jgi:hypothetical protein